MVANLWDGPHIHCHGSGGAISTFYNTVLSFSGNNSFINNTADGGSGGAHYASSNTVHSFNSFINNSAYQDGGVIFTWDDTVLSFSGTNSFIKNSAHLDGGPIFAWDDTVLASMEPTASPTTQHTIVVVQSAQILYLASVESATLSTTRDTIVVVPSLLMTVLCLDSMKPITSSTTRQIMRLVV